MIRPKPGKRPAHTCFVEKNPTLCNLPGEILAIIIDYLPISSEACLVCTCKQLYMILGTKSLLKLRQGSEHTENEKARFIKLVSRELPHLLYCHACARFHQQKINIDTSRALTAILRGHSHSGKPLWFRYAELAITARRLGSDFLLSLDDMSTALYCYGKTYPDSGACIIPVFNKIASMTLRPDILIVPRVNPVQGRLLFQLQVAKSIELATAGKVQMDPIWRGYRCQLAEVFEVVKCPDQAEGSVEFYAMILPMMHRVDEAWKSFRSYREVRQIRRCPHCATEAQFAVRLSTGGDCWIEVSYWRDLGSETDPSKRVWASHHFGVLSQRNLRYRPDWSFRQSIKAAFEYPDLPNSAYSPLHLHVFPMPPDSWLSGDLNRTEIDLATE